MSSSSRPAPAPGRISRPPRTRCFTSSKASGNSSPARSGARSDPGTLIYAPVGAMHAFKSLAPGQPGRMLSWNAPAGHERFYVGMGAARSSGRDPHEIARNDYHVEFER